MTRGKKSTSFFILVLLFLIGNSLAVNAITGSMGNAKMILYPEVNGWFPTTIEKTILVRNINNVSINISLKADSDGEKFLEIVDREFTLQPNGEKKAEFLIKVKNEGKYEGKINVFFTPAEGKEPGVVLSSSIVVIAKKNQEDKNETRNVNSTSDNILNVEKGKTNKGVIFLIISTFVLLAVLVFLLSMTKKRGRSKK